MMQSDGESAPEEEAGQVYETGDFVALFCGTAFGIEHWVCPVTREIIPFNGFVIGPGPAMESATDRYKVDPDKEVPVMVETEWHEDANEGATVVFRQEVAAPPEVELDVIDIVVAQPASYAETLLATALFGVFLAVILLIARRLSG